MKYYDLHKRQLMQLKSASISGEEFDENCTNSGIENQIIDTIV